MVNETDPITDNWYRHMDKGQPFRVVEVDETKMLVDIQYFDGNLEEIDLADWREMDIEPCEEPENWAGALDIPEQDDFGTSVTDTTPADWVAPLQEVPGESTSPLSAEADNEGDWQADLPLEEPWEEEP